MTLAQERSKPNWNLALIAVVLLLSWIGYCYWSTLEAMAQIWWRSETYAHGLVVPPITLWLIWRNRHHLAALQPQATFWLILPLAGFVFLWLLGELTAVNALTQFSVIGVIVLSIMSLLGLRISKELAFPLFFLFFAVPIGDFLLPRLMEWTADFTVIALRLSGIPVYREGQSFVIPSGQWSVIEACSGIRYLIASLTVGTLYAYLTYTSLKRRLIFILVSLLVPIVANWLRAYMIVMLGHLSGNKLAAGVDHLIYGWVFFGVVIAIMFAIGMRWAEPDQFEQPVRQPETFAHQQIRAPWLVTLILAMVIAAGPFTEAHLREMNSVATLKLKLPDAIGIWQSTPRKLDWQPQFANPSAELHTAYSSQENWAGVYIAYYRHQGFENKLVTSTNVLVKSNNTDWQIVANGLSTASIGGTEYHIREAELLDRRSGLDERYIIWQWYWINGQLTSNDIEAKLLTAKAMLTGHGDDAATIILYAPKAGATRTLTSFATEAASEIHRALSEAQKQ